MSYSRTTRLLGPAFEHATVGDAMRTGIISCRAETPLRQVAEMMASYHVHAIVVDALAGSGVGTDSRSWTIVSDLDLARAAGNGELDRNAGELAGRGGLQIAPDAPLKRAAALMSEHGVSHLIVSTSADARPVGIISSLDLAVALAWGRD